MTRNAFGRETVSPEADRKRKSQKSRQWARLGQLVFSKPKEKKLRFPEDRQSNEQDRTPVRATSRLADYGFLQRYKFGGESSEAEAGSAPKSLRGLKKTKTFSAIFGRGSKAKSGGEDECKDSDDDIAFSLPQVHPQSSSSDQQTSPEEDQPSSSARSERLRWMKGSNANRTMMFKGDLPPCSPLSTKGMPSGENETGNGCEPNDAGEPEASVIKPHQSDEVNAEEKNHKKQEGARGEEDITPTSTNSSRRVISLKNTLFNMRLGSIVFDDSRVASRLTSSPLGSPRGFERRASSVPRKLGIHATRSASEPNKIYGATTKAVSNEYDSPWGVKDIPEAENETETRNSSKSFRMTDLVHGLKGRKLVHSESDSLSLTDDEINDGSDASQHVDMLEDEFVDYSVRQINKNNRHKSSRNKTKKGRASVSQIF